jgi:flagellar biosynthesis protein FlhG
MTGPAPLADIAEVTRRTGIEASRILFFEREFSDLLGRAPGRSDLTRFSEAEIAAIQRMHQLAVVERRPLDEVRRMLSAGGMAAASAPHVLTVTSGKGGVGKTTVALNLAVALAGGGRKVVLFDADFGLANVHVLAGINPRATLVEFLNGSLPMADLLMPGPGGIRVVCGGSGISGMADLDAKQMTRVGRELLLAAAGCDVVVVDTAAGASRGVLHFLQMADSIVVVATPNLASTLDAYSLIKLAHQEGIRSPLHLLVNLAESEEEGASVYERVSSCAARFLGRAPAHLGSIVRDPIVEQAARQRSPLVLAHPRSDAAGRLAGIAAQLAGHLRPRKGPRRRPARARPAENFAETKSS